jgi:3-methylcrotonyl-CoA carboxylase alpha subunit
LSRESLAPVLVANRGEIAVRILRTCQRLELATVAVYSDADAQALHVAEADRAERIGRPPAAESYLNQAAILRAAERAHARSVHPGYGFLAENAEFAQQVIDAGLVWIGPPPGAMRAIGDKARAKALAQAEGVPLLRGYHGEDSSAGTLQREAERIGYPLLIKASAGGGGRGMRVVESARDFAGALEAARREALGSFGDDRVLLEQYVASPRHVEVQIMGDLHGTLIHLGERECSIQRRHQKLIEETPSPAVDADLRGRMGEAALRLARAAGYASAGTVEFLLGETGDFAFLEVNARLQVEHPVTEAVTGLDLVELQLRIAAGEPLPLGQSDLSFYGHAIEARVIAEDPLANFLPSSGTVRTFQHPADIRVDTWVRAATVVSPYYDSLLAKVIAHDATRTGATLRLAQAIRDTHIDGIQQNLDLLLATVQSPAFILGDLNTGFLEQHHVVEELRTLPTEVLAAAAGVDHAHPLDQGDPWRAQSGWRIGRLQQPVAWTRAGVRHDALISHVPARDAISVSVGGTQVEARRPVVDTAGRWRVNLGGATASVWDLGALRVVEWGGRSYRLERPQPLSVENTQRDRGAGGGGRGSLSAPMPARVVRIAVNAGEVVQANQPLVVLEAMKMEHVVEAPHAGTVMEVCVEVGEQVASGARLLTIGSADESENVQ